VAQQIRQPADSIDLHVERGQAIKHGKVLNLVDPHREVPWQDYLVALPFA
jgi:hypothetical protein